MLFLSLEPKGKYDDGWIEVVSWNRKIDCDGNVAVVLNILNWIFKIFYFGYFTWNFECLLSFDRWVEISFSLMFLGEIFKVQKGEVTMVHIVVEIVT